jgi:hypothetical protein
MNNRKWERGLWLAAMLVLARGTVAALRAPRASWTLVPVPAVPGPTAAPDSEALLDAISVIREGDLFRVERQPPARVPPVQTVIPQLTNPVPRPVVTGLIGGPPWSAVVEGIAGVEGATVLQVGQSIGDITLRAIRRDTIILRGKDSTWKLTVRNSWQKRP